MSSGPTDAGNLALSCTVCNIRKGSDISSIDPESGLIDPLFNPRETLWRDHFDFDGPTLIGLSACGRTTLTFLRLNSAERKTERNTLIDAKVIPFYRGPGKPR